MMKSLWIWLMLTSLSPAQLIDVHLSLGQGAGIGPAEWVRVGEVFELRLWAHAKEPASFDVFEISLAWDPERFEFQGLWKMIGISWESRDVEFYPVRGVSAEDWWAVGRLFYRGTVSPSQELPVDGSALKVYLLRFLAKTPTPNAGVGFWRSWGTLPPTGILSFDQPFPYFVEGKLNGIWFQVLPECSRNESQHSLRKPQRFSHCFNCHPRTSPASTPSSTARSPAGRASREGWDLR